MSRGKKDRADSIKRWKVLYLRCQSGWSHFAFVDHHMHFKGSPGFGVFRPRSCGPAAAWIIYILYLAVYFIYFGFFEIISL